MRTFFLVAIGLLLCACATSNPDPNYGAYLAANRDASIELERRITAIANTDDCPEDDGACVIATKAIAGLTLAAGAGANAKVEPYRPQRSTAAAIGLALVGQLSPLASAAVAWHAQDTSRDVQIAQYGFLEGIVRSTSDAAAAIAEAGPRIEVGGNYGDTYGEYVGGDRVGGNLGDTYGDDFTGGDRTDVGNDQIGGDRIDNSGNIGEGNRQESPGPIDDRDGGDGGECPGGTGGEAEGGAGGACEGGNGGG